MSNECLGDKRRRASAARIAAMHRHAKRCEQFRSMTHQEFTKSDAGSSWVRDRLEWLHDENQIADDCGYKQYLSCDAPECADAATTPFHRIPMSQEPELALDAQNVIYLCDRCSKRFLQDDRFRRWVRANNCRWDDCDYHQRRRPWPGTVVSVPAVKVVRGGLVSPK